MVHIPVTLLYGSLTALLLTILGLNVTRLRLAKDPGLASAPNPQLHRLVRAHGNCAEWAPILILLLLILELAGAGSTVLHLFGGGLLLGRVLHAIGFSTRLKTSVIGATLTYLVAFAMPVYALLLHFR